METTIVYRGYIGIMENTIFICNFLSPVRGTGSMLLMCVPLPLHFFLLAREPTLRSASCFLKHLGPQDEQWLHLAFG